MILIGVPRLSVLRRAICAALSGFAVGALLIGIERYVWTFPAGCRADLSQR